MPHYQLSPPYDDEPSRSASHIISRHRRPEEPSPDPRRGTTAAARILRSGDRTTSSCRLTTLSPDGRTIHTFLRTRNCIQTCRLLPAPDQPQDATTTTTTTSAIISTALPDWVREALAIDAAVELVCVEGETQQQPTLRTTHGSEQQQQHHHSVCLCTSKSVYFIQFAIILEPDGAAGAAAAGGGWGEIRSVTEPLERALEEYYPTSSATVVRVRAAPRSVTLVPPGSFAVLVEIQELCEYILFLHHGADGSITIPLKWGVEDVVDEEDCFTDFCFAESHGLSLFSALSVLLLKSSGDVLAASPIVFDRTVVSRTSTDEARGYLQEQLDLLERSSAKWRQCRSAMQYFLDVFVGSENRSQFVTSQVLGLREQSAGNWPIKVQGPILFHSGVDPGPAAIAIEAFGSSDVAVGVAIGRLSGCIDFAVLSPTSLLPRFDYESRNDAYDLDDRLVELAALVERVDLGIASNERFIQILGDPVAGTLLHYVTPSQVLTVSTNALKVASRKLKGGDSDGQRQEAVHTTAWTSLNSGEPIQGIVIPDDATLGHNLIAQLQSGTRVTLDVTESKYIHEFQSVFQQVSQTSVSTSLTTQPFYTEVEPLVQKINAGLSNMGRIVGSETSYKDITPDALAVALSVKKRCDMEVVMPLLELKKLIEQRREIVRMTLQKQQNQMETILQQMNVMKEGLSKIGEKLQLAGDNAAQLTERSTAVLQTSRELLPTITQAEYDYFKEMKRLNVKVTQLEKEASGLVEITQTRCAAVKEKSDVCLNAMSEEYKQKANTLLNHEEKMLKKIRKRVHTTNQRMKVLLEQNRTSQQ